MKHIKLLTIGGLPLMWGLYFLFELFTGRISDPLALMTNIILIAIFFLFGYIIHIYSLKHTDGLPFKKILFLFCILMLLDQGIKIIIKFYFFNNNIVLINEMLSFNPLINTQGSWLNARFGTSVSFPILILVNTIALFLLLEIYRYLTSKRNSTFFGDCAFIFLFSGALCSLIDKIFYGGSLDFIGISNLFVADIKDIYINLGLYFFILSTYSSGYLTGSDDSTIKDDFIVFKKFVVFVRNDLISILKR
ncbi:MULTISPECIES: signal peptidase II [Clostridium]|uniref:Signal peptidase II n=1 Tax=Clostridium cibarium TaxID=2762247 RepID=A0ABR8PZ99_9CLOT|nr:MULTISPECIES: signal peptidase II [Clostridium]MBD7913489.1 signal peptidase II [Clostridium cibarium]